MNAPKGNPMETATRELVAEAAGYAVTRATEDADAAIAGGATAVQAAQVFAAAIDTHRAYFVDTLVAQVTR